MSTDASITTASPTIQERITDAAHQASDAVHHAADAVRGEFAAISGHFTSLLTTANVEGLIPEVEGLLLLLPPVLAAGEVSVGSLLTAQDIAVLEQMVTKVGAVLVREFLNRKPLPAVPAPAPPASTTETERK